MTDLHQGIVWGTNTEQTARDERLVNRFDYDGEYGTVLNRFLMQAACGIPLTVYGTGGQTRAFIHISDTCKCIELAVANPPQAGERVEILNQVRTSNPRTWQKVGVGRTRPRVYACVPGGRDGAGARPRNDDLGYHRLRRAARVQPAQRGG